VAKVFFWAGDTDGSSWWRTIMPGTGLTWLGHQVGASTNFPPEWHDADVVIGSRIAKPVPSRKWRAMKAEGKRLIIDLDDDYTSLDPRIHPPAAMAEWGALLPRLIENIRISDVVTVASEGIAEPLRQYNQDVRVIPNALPAQYLGIHREYRKDVVTVGWAGSRSTFPELESIRRVLSKASRLPGTRVCLVGPPPGDPVLSGFLGPEVWTAGFKPPGDEYLQAVNHFDIWLAPYADSKFNRAKFPTKALEAGFLGIPLIASAIRPYEEAIEHGKTGYLVRSDYEWTRYVKKLVEDPDLRLEIGLNARAQASKSILQSMNQQWEAVLS
jgi:glycosyltransferase involved in cell wall biosynthesis